MYSLHEGEDNKKRGFAPLKLPRQGKIRTFVTIYLIIGLPMGKQEPPTWQWVQRARGKGSSAKPDLDETKHSVSIPIVRLTPQTNTT